MGNQVVAACCGTKSESVKHAADAANMVPPVPQRPQAYPPPPSTPTQHVNWPELEYDYDITTEDAFGVLHFTGDNRDIRPLLDYTYHKKYRNDRTNLQDRIISELYSEAHNQDDLMLPWVLFTAGAMGAGKGHVLHWMDKQGYIPLNQFVTVDPDQIRQALPEWEGYVARDPETAAVKTQKEAGHIAEILGYKALGDRRNVIFDGSLRDVEWYKKYFAKLRQQFPGIRVMILHIQAERDEVLKRAEERGKQTGRAVPRKVLLDSMEAVPISVAALAPCADVALRVMNLSNQDPELHTEEGAVNPPEGVPASWEYIMRLWKPIDSASDGELTKAEVIAAIAQGILTEAVVDTIDIDGNGHISMDDFRRAIQTCKNNATMRLRGGTFIDLNEANEQRERAKKIDRRSMRWSVIGK